MRLATYPRERESSTACDVIGPHKLNQLAHLVGAPLRDVRGADQVDLSIGVRITEVREGLSLPHPAEAAPERTKRWSCVAASGAPRASELTLWTSRADLGERRVDEPLGF